MFDKCSITETVYIPPTAISGEFKSLFQIPYPQHKYENANSIQYSQRQYIYLLITSIRVTLLIGQEEQTCAYIVFSIGTNSHNSQTF